MASDSLLCQASEVLGLSASSLSWVLFTLLSILGMFCDIKLGCLKIG